MALGKKIIPGKKTNFTRKIWNTVMAPGVKKLLGLLDRVTGEAFVHQFIDAVSTIYMAQESFRDALELESTMADPKVCQWYLVTAADHSKLEEALILQKDSKAFYKGEVILWINRCLHDDVKTWEPKSEIPRAKDLQQALVSREEKIIFRAKESFTLIKLFPESLTASSQEQVLALVQAQA